MMILFLRALGILFLFGAPAFMGYAGGVRSLGLFALALFGGVGALDLIRRVLGRLEAGRA